MATGCVGGSSSRSTRTGSNNGIGSCWAEEKVRASAYPSRNLRTAGSASGSEANKQAGALTYFAGEQAHPPAVVGGVNAGVQQALVAQRQLRKIVLIDRPGGRAPEAGPQVHDLTHGVQLAADLKVQHLRADDHGR